MEKSPYTLQDYIRLKERLQGLADPKYKAFHASLVPGLSQEAFLGVPIPLLRKEAKEIAKGDFRGFLALAQDALYELCMIHGLVIGLANWPLEERLEACREFIPRIENWAICDCFCGALKCAKKEPEALFSFIQPYFKMEDAYAVRFGCVMLLEYFLGEEYIDQTLALYDGVKHPDYYVKMAVSWGISTAMVHQWDKTIDYLSSPACHLDAWTYNKALQKGRESRRISPEKRELLQSMKR